VRFEIFLTTEGGCAMSCGKRWYLLLAWVSSFILYVSPLYAEHVSFDLKQHDLNGPVKNVIETNADFKDIHGKWRQSGIHLLQEIMFNRQGKKTNEIMYSGGNQTQKVDYIYDGSGMIMEIKYIGINWEKIQHFDESGKMIEEIRHDTRYDRILESWLKTEEKHGITIEYKNYYSDGRLHRYETTSFDRAGRVKKKVNDPAGDDFRKWEYDYDADGNLLQGKYFDKSYNPKETWHSAYDERGNLVEVRHNNIQYKSNLHSIRTYFYDDRNRLIRQLVRRYSQNGDLEYTFSYSYDVLGNVIEEVYQHEEANFSTKWSYTYDPMNERTRETFYNSEGMVFTGYHVTNEYDSDGRLVDTIRHDLSGVQQSRTSHSYNEHGHLTESTTYNPDNSLNSVTTYEYIYDEWGNWIEKRTFTTNNLRETYNIPTLVQFRTISYYD